jgi:hypothetical protein
MNNNSKTGVHLVETSRDKQLWEQNEKPPLEGENSFKALPAGHGGQNFDSSRGGKETKNG